MQNTSSVFPVVILLHASKKKLLVRSAKELPTGVAFRVIANRCDLTQEQVDQVYKDINSL